MNKSHGYSIVIKEGDFEDGDYFEARVVELPDLLVYAETANEAYLDAVDLIEITAESFEEDGKIMPVICTDEGSNDDYDCTITGFYKNGVYHITDVEYKEKK